MGTNYANRSELYLLHRHEGIDLRVDYAKDVMVHLQKIWTRPVHIETKVKGKPKLMSFDGTDHKEQELDESSVVWVSDR